MQFVDKMGFPFASYNDPLCYKPEGRGFDSDEVIGFFNWPNPATGTYGPGVGSASNRNEYQESSRG
jgi:hypothetical protein